MPSDGSGVPTEPSATKGDFKLLMGLTLGILTVVGIALITFVLQYFSATQASNEALVAEIAEQKAKVEFMTNLLLQTKNHTQEIHLDLTP